MVIQIDLSTPRKSHVKASHAKLASLNEGDTYVHDHSGYETPFTVWLAQLRKRLGKNFTSTRRRGRRPVYIIGVVPTRR